MMRASLVLLLAFLVAAPADAQRSPSGQQPSRDTPAQPQTAQATGTIGGRVTAADTGRPVKRARVLVSAPELPQSRAAQTDDAGAYEISGLPAGRYVVSVSKAGFVTLSYGQRRPLQPGTPLQLAAQQELKGVDFRLPRGGVIAGRLFDEDGDSLVGAFVRVMEYRYQQGRRQLVPVGTTQSDDRGEYRVWGLMPGAYFVSAVARTPGGFGPQGGGGPGMMFVGRMGAGSGGDDGNSVAYAPTYYPGVSAMGDARSVAVGLSQEVQDINFAVQLVQTSRVAGRATSPDGATVSVGMVALSPEVAGTTRGQLGMTFAARIEGDGAFSIGNVPPGRYVLRARAGDSEQPLFAVQSLTVAGDMTNLMVMLAPGATLSGTLTFDASQQHLTGIDPTSIRVTVLSLDQGAGSQQPTARVDKDGRFTLNGVPAGGQLIRAQGVSRDWMLKAVTVDGRDVTDTPVEFRAGQTTGGIRLSFTDRVSEVSGTVTDGQGAPVTELTILAFPSDAVLWRPQARQIMTARPDQNGRFVIRGLPPGDYYLATVDPAEQGEWFEPAFLDAHRNEAVRLTLTEGDAQTHDFTVGR